MTNDWNERRGLVITLGLVALGVWGYTLTTFVRATAVAGPTLAAPVHATASLPPHFEDPGRDPFEPPVQLDPELAGLTLGGPSSSFPTWDGGGAPLGGGSPGSALSTDLGASVPSETSGWDRAVPEEPLPPPDLGPPTCQLVGVVGRSALLRTAAGQPVTVTVGDVVDGFDVAAVRRDAVTLTDGPRTHTLTF